MKGKFIAIEGGEGAGKDTHIDLLRKEFGEENFVFTREPGGTPLGKELREMLLHHSKGNVTLPAELFLFLADRAQHIEELVLPSLLAGKNVISNRSWISFMAYQIYGREQYDWQSVVEMAIEKIYQSTPLDLAIILDLDPTVGRERMKEMGKKLDIMEGMSLESHERIRKAFLSIAKGLPHAVIIDASRDKEAVWKDVKEAVQSTLT